MENYKTIKVLFADSISKIDKMFDNAKKEVTKWGVSTLKEWIESYETTRFTHVDEHTAIITSEYNIDFVKEWLRTHILNSNIQDIN